MSNDIGVMEFEVDARLVDHRARLAITNARFTPGLRYRVTVTPADAPRPEPAGYVRKYSEGPYPDAAPIYQTEDQARSLCIGHFDGKVVPLYEHPPAPVDAEPDAYAITRNGRTVTCRTKREDAEDALKARGDCTIEPLYRHPQAPSDDYDQALQDVQENIGCPEIKMRSGLGAAVNNIRDYFVLKPETLAEHPAWVPTSRFL